MHELTDDAAGALGRDEWNAQQHDDAEPMAAPRLRSLFACLGEVPECRKARGKRCPPRTVLAIAVAARFAALLSQERLEAVDSFFSPSRKRCTAPSITTFHNILADLPPETLDDAVGRWTARQAGAATPLAMDGKDIRGASKQTGEGRRMMVAAAGHGTGMALRQVEVDAKSNEIPAVRELSGSLDVTGRIVTVDAMHARHETARCLLGRRADHVVTAVKDNQETIRVEREREILKTGERSVEVTWCLTSLGPERAGPEELLELVRNHWVIENADNPAMPTGGRNSLIPN